MILSRRLSNRHLPVYKNSPQSDAAGENEEEQCLKTVPVFYCSFIKMLDQNWQIAFRILLRNLSFGVLIDVLYIASPMKTATSLTCGLEVSA